MTSPPTTAAHLGCTPTFFSPSPITSFLRTPGCLSPSSAGPLSSNTRQRPVFRFQFQILGEWTWLASWGATAHDLVLWEQTLRMGVWLLSLKDKWRVEEVMPSQHLIPSQPPFCRQEVLNISCDGALTTHTAQCHPLSLITHYWLRALKSSLLLS